MHQLRDTWMPLQLTCILIPHFHALLNLPLKKNKNETLMTDVLPHLNDLHNQKNSLFPVRRTSSNIKQTIFSDLVSLGLKINLHLFDVYL